MKTLLLAAIRAYRYLLSPWWGGACRFTPTCSVFAEEALERHGAARGTWLAFKRVGRCHPWCAGGFDPVP
jgi:putative membrane protein insertion efficiency factor